MKAISYMTFSILILIISPTTVSWEGKCKYGINLNLTQKQKYPQKIQVLARPGHGLRLIRLDFLQALNSFPLTAKTRYRSNTWRS